MQILEMRLKPRSICLIKNNQANLAALLQFSGQKEAPPLSSLVITA